MTRPPGAAKDGVVGRPGQEAAVGTSVIRMEARGGLALASLLVAVAGFCLGTYEAFSRLLLGDGGDPLAYRVMLWAVLPAGLAAVACGALAVGLIGPARPDGPATTRSAAWWGIAIGSLVIGLAAAGAFFMFLDLAGPA
jgi:hypothetical protein